MNSPSSASVHQRRFGSIAAALVTCMIFFSGCDYEIPLTAEPTRHADARLMGDWLAKDGWMKVRRSDATTLIIFHNGELYRAFHSDFNDTAFVSLQNIDSDQRKYAYAVYALSEDGRRLTVKFVSDKIVPKTIKDPAEMQKLLRAKARDPDLFGEETMFVRQD